MVATGLPVAPLGDSQGCGGEWCDRDRQTPSGTRTNTVTAGIIQRDRPHQCDLAKVQRVPYIQTDAAV